MICCSRKIKPCPFVGGCKPRWSHGVGLHRRGMRRQALTVVIAWGHSHKRHIQCAIFDCSMQGERLLIFPSSSSSSLSSVSAGHCSHRSCHHAVSPPFSQHTSTLCPDLASMLILAKLFILVWLYYKSLGLPRRWEGIQANTLSLVAIKTRYCLTVKLLGSLWQ